MSSRMYVCMYVCLFVCGDSHTLQVKFVACQAWFNS